MKKEIIKDIGIIDLEHVTVGNGQMEVHIPLDEIGEKADMIIEKCFMQYKESYPDIDVKKDTFWDFRLMFSFGYANPEFEIMVVVWQQSDEEGSETAEIYDGFQVTLSKEDSNKIKKIIWDKLGETLFNI